MRIRDAFAAAQDRQNKAVQKWELSTKWGEKLNPEHVLAEYPRPQLRRDSWICLNGLWKYAFTKKPVRPEQPEGDILVPFSPECRASGVNRRLEPGRNLWYFRDVELKEIPKNKKLFLHFGAVDQRCTVWWNGNVVGRHQNGYLAFSLDVTEYVRKGKNTITVRVQDDSDESCHARGKQTLNPKGMFYTAQSGIWQTVWMEWVPENHIEELKITPLYDEKCVRLEIALGRPERLEIRLFWEGDTFSHYVNKRDFDEQTGKYSRDIPLPGFRAWSPEDPFLYDLEIIAEEDVVQSYFAMRKFSVGMDEQKRPRLMLNNEPYFFNGVLDQGYWPESLYTAPDDQAMIFDIQKMKELGFNMIRKHIKIEPMRWYYHCDRLGMAVWQDMVNGGGRMNMFFVCYLPTILPWIGSHVRDNLYHLFSRSGKTGRKQWEEECIEEVKQLYNCPCIGLWVPFNEGWGQFDALRITEKIRRIDPTRQIDHASGWFDQGGGDVKSVHNYFRPLRVKKDKRPFVLSEYGGYTCAVKGHIYSDGAYGYKTYPSTEAFSTAFAELQQKVHALEKKGLSAAVYTQVSDIEEEINGLYTYDRKICKVDLSKMDQENK